VCAQAEEIRALLERHRFTFVRWVGAKHGAKGSHALWVGDQQSSADPS